MTTIALAGNKFQDHIFYCDELVIGGSNIAMKSKISSGGISNMSSWFNKRGIYPHCFKSDEPAIANIIIEKGRKTSIVDWGRSVEFNGKEIVNWLSYLSFPYPKIIHFAYLDSLPNLNIDIFEHLKDKNVKISGDFCKTNTKITKEVESYLPYFDYIFCSDNEFSEDKLDSLLKILNKAEVFWHKPSGSKHISNSIVTESFFEESLIIKKPEHLVGAGDIFAARIISGLVTRRFVINDYKVLMERAHEECRKYIKASL